MSSSYVCNWVDHKKAGKPHLESSELFAKMKLELNASV